MTAVAIARVYDRQASAEDAVLVDRLWPRGISKDDAPFARWVKDVAPSTELRKWYGHEPTRFEQFSARYRRELEESPAKDTLAELLKMDRVILMTATKDLARSGAAVLRDVLQSS